MCYERTSTLGFRILKFLLIWWFFMAGTGWEVEPSVHHHWMIHISNPAQNEIRSRMPGIPLEELFSVLWLPWAISQCSMMYLYAPLYSHSYGKRNVDRGFTYQQWWFSIAILNYQRANNAWIFGLVIFLSHSLSLPPLRGHGRYLSCRYSTV